MNFTNLKKYKRILVTGPQRSGTRITAKMITQDTRHRYVDEEEFSTHSVFTFNIIISHESNIVVQCPGMCHIIHKYSADDLLIVMMIRDIDDIVASEKRVDWVVGYYDELLKYGYPSLNTMLRKARRDGVLISELKYKFWKKIQRDMVENYIELEYESLCDHPLWMPKELRKNFDVRQTK